MEFDLEQKVIDYLNALKPPVHNNGKHPVFSKSELYKAVGLDKTNSEFDKLWRVLTKNQNGAYLAHQGNGKWMYFH